ncbi:hypothetical protein KSP40_PGU001968 [Platanthera guangdongensis]|uniref:Uncharacterized protein n=1 Tax=Platanthera guangdongensis TaxID=2320717 RepID=A0ABR2LWT8_9ASPA
MPSMPQRLSAEQESPGDSSTCSPRKGWLSSTARQSAPASRPLSCSKQISLPLWQRFSLLCFAR